MLNALGVEAVPEASACRISRTEKPTESGPYESELVHKKPDAAAKDGPASADAEKKADVKETPKEEEPKKDEKKEESSPAKPAPAAASDAGSPDKKPAEDAKK